MTLCAGFNFREEAGHFDMGPSPRPLSIQSSSYSNEFALKGAAVPSVGKAEQEFCRKEKRASGIGQA